LLQELLWLRVRGRCSARSRATLSAGLYHATTADLDRTGGMLPACARRGRSPTNPYARAKRYVNVDADAPPARRAGAALQLEDVTLLERFYNQLCLLVEAQKSSDPQSLIIVQLVRGLRPASTDRLLRESDRASGLLE
jgi:hypothetical protein